MTLHLSGFFYIILFLWMPGRSAGNFHAQILLTSFPQLLAFNVGLIFLVRVKSMPISVTSQALSLQMKIAFCGEILIFLFFEPELSSLGRWGMGREERGGAHYSATAGGFLSHPDNQSVQGFL